MSLAQRVRRRGGALSTAASLHSPDLQPSEMQAAGASSTRACLKRRPAVYPHKRCVHSRARQPAQPRAARACGGGDRSGGGAGG